MRNNMVQDGMVMTMMLVAENRSTRAVRSPDDQWKETRQEQPMNVVDISAADANRSTSSQTDYQQIYTDNYLRKDDKIVDWEDYEGYQRIPTKENEINEEYGEGSDEQNSKEKSEQEEIKTDTEIPNEEEPNTEKPDKEKPDKEKPEKPKPEKPKPEKPKPEKEKPNKDKAKPQKAKPQGGYGGYGSYGKPGGNKKKPHKKKPGFFMKPHGIKKRPYYGAHHDDEEWDEDEYEEWEEVDLDLGLDIGDVIHEEDEEVVGYYEYHKPFFGIKKKKPFGNKYKPQHNKYKPQKGKPQKGKPQKGKPDKEKPDKEKPDKDKPDKDKPDKDKPDKDKEKPDKDKPDKDKEKQKSFGTQVLRLRVSMKIRIL